MLFAWNAYGLKKITANYDWAFNEYKGFKLAIELAYKSLDK